MSFPKHHLKYYSILLFLIVSSTSSIAQVGIGTTSPDVSSILDISSTESGVLIPRMTENERDNIATPLKGLLIFQNDGEEGFWYFDGTIWVPLTPSDTVGEFISLSGVIRNTTSIQFDDFVVGSTSLDNLVGNNDNNRLFFDKGRGAFRAGSNGTTSWDNTNIGTNSIGLGLDNTASGSFTVALGRNTRAIGTYAVSIGRDNVVEGQSATSFGAFNESSGDNATSFGLRTIAGGENAIAGGSNTDALGPNTIALGLTSTASGENAIALGNLDNATALNSVAIGFQNTASGVGSHALGNESEASGVNSVVIGDNLAAPSYGEVVVGTYNERYTPTTLGITASVGTDRIFSVGNGFRTGGVTTFNNALTILKNGFVGIGTDVDDILTEKLEVKGKIKAVNVNFSGLPIFENNTAASSLEVGDMYRTAAGDLKIRI